MDLSYLKKSYIGLPLFLRVLFNLIVRIMMCFRSDSQLNYLRHQTGFTKKKTICNICDCVICDLSSSRFYMVKPSQCGRRYLALSFLLKMQNETGPVFQLPKKCIKRLLKCQGVLQLLILLNLSALAMHQSIISHLLKIT